MQDAIEWEKEVANRVLNDVRTLLANSEPRLTGLLEEAWDRAFPFLKRGRHKNPIHHTAYVVKHAVKIGLEQLEDDGELAQLIVAAVFHDSGNAVDPKVESKITVEHVRADPTQKADAIKQRNRHMAAGGKFVRLFLTERDSGIWTFNGSQIGQIVKLVEIHDNPTIAQLEAGEERKAYLFDIRQTLAAILREADRLWMLTVDGLVTDMVRKQKKGKPWQPLAQITHNAIRHHEERQLYEEEFRQAVSEFEFDDDTAFYRTRKGKGLFRELQRQSRHPKTVPDWDKLVQDAELREMLVD